jgi:hypothetical protein
LPGVLAGARHAIISGVFADLARRARIFRNRHIETRVEPIAGGIGDRRPAEQEMECLKRVPLPSGDDVLDDRLGKPDHKLLEPIVFNFETVECPLHLFIPVDLA